MGALSRCLAATPIYSASSDEKSACDAYVTLFLLPDFDGVSAQHTTVIPAEIMAANKRGLTGPYSYLFGVEALCSRCSRRYVFYFYRMGIMQLGVSCICGAYTPEYYYTKMILTGYRGV